MRLRTAICAIICLFETGSAADSNIISLAQRYLANRGDAGVQVSNEILSYTGPITPIIKALEASEPKRHKDVTGTLFGEHFTEPTLQTSHPADLLNFLVPKTYSPTRPFGLLIFMHGGGSGTKREYARSVLSNPATDRYSYGLQAYFTNSQSIVVAPSAPWNDKSSARWNLPEADAYIDAVIRECRYRFNIDRDRIFLGGQSMGGFGAYHLCQRLADRLAGGILYAGAWKSARWENMIGTPLFIRHGRNDAVAPKTPDQRARPRYTDVFYANSASRLLTAVGAEHVYVEDDGGHSIRAASNSVARLVGWMTEQQRDPYAPRVVAQTPRGWNATRDTPTPHSRWITILDSGPGTLPFDEVARTGPGPSWNESRESFFNQGFKLIKRNLPAANVEARNHGDNRMTIKTRNVKHFALWLHPKMVEFSQPLRITINGSESVHRVKPSLFDALRSCERRGDWGLVYHAELRLHGDVKSTAQYPQWRGPNRDGLVNAFPAPAKWPKDLDKVWEIPVGEGYSCPISDGTRVYLHTRTDGNETVNGVDLATGKELWQSSYPASARVHPAGKDHGLGPKSTPAIHDGRLYTLGIGSILSCFDARTGRLYWRKNFQSEFPEPAPSCGTSMSPLIVDDMCIVHVGVDRKGRMIAFDAKTGREQWSYDHDGPGYGSPIVAQLNGRRQIVSPVSKFIVGLSPTSGERLWRFPFPTKSTQNIITPVAYKDGLIIGGIAQVTSCIRPGKTIETVWQNRDIPLHMCSPVRKGNRLIGLTSRNSGQLFCVDTDTGKTIWQSEARFADNASVLHTGSHLVCLTSDGRLIFAKADSDRYAPVATYQVTDNRTWAHPLISGKRIIIRDARNLTCWQIN